MKDSCHKLSPRVTHICVGNLTIIGSDNGLSPGRRQAINWTNAEILLIGPLGVNFSENQYISFKEMYLKLSSAKWRLFPLGLNELMRAIMQSSLPVLKLPHTNMNQGSIN